MVICPLNQTSEADFNKHTTTIVWNQPVATDNSELAPIVTCNAANGSQFEIGETEIICQALDYAGNLKTCFFTIGVKG